ncbi:hypothetical protein EL22_04805 [Halostagnicola sp. A56]|uniref:hypothetical protein n=1 Tax=Halostagnicola sp. A56 TaxID=1495067 RepID=UPI0004A195B8|nr:hypothetical protein [Halostagnicola sp. A56]KDE58435.1 hypothetical protein EL22_04805 [Halostagnicola sp. A56]
MSEPPEDSPPYSTGPPDRQTLRLLERHLTSDALVSETVFDPDSYEPWLLRGRLEAERYPDSVTAARLDVRWFTTGDFSVHYVEEHEDGDRWECRWDRHLNTHNARLHFHKPPSAAAIADLELPSLHPLEVYSTVLTAIAQRIETLWSVE